MMTSVKGSENLGCLRLWPVFLESLLHRLIWQPIRFWVAKRQNVRTHVSERWKLDPKLHQHTQAGMHLWFVRKINCCLCCWKPLYLEDSFLCSPFRFSFEPVQFFVFFYLPLCSIISFSIKFSFFVLLHLTPDSSHAHEKPTKQHTADPDEHLLWSLLSAVQHAGLENNEFFLHAFSSVIPRHSTILPPLASHLLCVSHGFSPRSCFCVLDAPAINGEVSFTHMETLVAHVFHASPMCFQSKHSHPKPGRTNNLATFPGMSYSLTGSFPAELALITLHGWLADKLGTRHCNQTVYQLF